MDGQEILGKIFKKRGKRYMTRKKEGETTLYKLNKAKKEQRKQEK